MSTSQKKIKKIWATSHFQHRFYLPLFLGPTGEAYPHEAVAKFVRRKEGRKGRNLQNG